MQFENDPEGLARTIFHVSHIYIYLDNIYIYISKHIIIITSRSTFINIIIIIIKLAT